MIYRLFATFFVFLLIPAAAAQVELRGTVTDAETGQAIIGATIVVSGSARGTAADLDGVFVLRVGSLPVDLRISSIGYQATDITVTTDDPLTIQLVAGIDLDELVVVGSKGQPRTVLTSMVPIDNINAAELSVSGQLTVDQMINFRVPSYNSSNQTISDATAHFDPSELRNMGPSRTLVLVNGKRKNQSALVYVNDTPGKGEVGVDMKSIPASAIERVEVLRDGASAIYGSDAIAGVVNIVLKERLTGEVSATTGVTIEGDGLFYAADANKGFAVGEGGILNVTGSFYHQDYTNRAGEPGRDDLFGVDGTNSWIQSNPDLGMMVGQPEYDKGSLTANYSMPTSGGEVYAFGGGTFRRGKSFALYRAPYWITDDFGLLTPSGEAYDGFQPTFETDILDAFGTVGTRQDIQGWNADVSVSGGTNSVDYTIGNSINVDLGASSPTEFDAGSYTFGNFLGNLDVSKTIDKLSVSVGSEARRESFDVKAGQEESYTGSGAQSFPGLQPGNALTENRTNIGVYASADYDATETFLVGGAARFENYSDFGSNLSWKVSARQLIGDNKGVVRASVNTGFRAPSLHQIYLSNIQTLVSGGTVSNQGTFNNVSDVITGLGVPRLDAETSFSVTAGLAYRLNDQLSVSADYYNISLNDRVLFTGEIGFDGDDTSTNPVEDVLVDFDVTSIKFFVNAMDTQTQGVDVVVNYVDVALGEAGTLDLIWASNYNDTQIQGQIAAPMVFADAGYDIFNRKEQSRVTTARPKIKSSVSARFNFGKVTGTLNNTYFGEVTWQHAVNPSLDQTFAGKVLTDVILGYDVTNQVSITATVNNLLNVYPDPIQTGGDVVTDLGGRFKWPWEVNQFGFNGTTFRFGVTVDFR
ncbi:MAG: TonB-dependent receptor [Rhodothermales bacterium]|nr:TonB-dependent receptor [Rhodothermales bacterium]